MTTNPPDLPSKVEETLAICPKFRILVVGNSGVGKSSLVSSVFNVVKDIDIAHGRAGTADIAHEYTADSNPRFILHDSQGFEPGEVVNWETVQNFIRDRCNPNRPLKDRLHTIWLCIQTPRTGSRLMETGDQELLRLATECRIPVILVFTKYDLLFKEKFIKLRKGSSSQAQKVQDAEDAAASDLDRRLSEYKDFDFKSVSWVKVSTDLKYRDALARLEMLRTLTKVTRNCLHDVEGDLLVPWATAQHINARQKVDYSIDEGFKKYWIELGKSTVFEGHVLWDCISRIHRDILEVWNFHDPDKVLNGQEFSQRMIGLIQPLLLQPEPQSNMSQISDLVSLASAITVPFGQVVAGLGFASIVIRFLFSKYQKSSVTALCLGAYIVDLTLILHTLFIEMLIQEPPRPVSMELTCDILQNFKNGTADRVHGLVQDLVHQKTALGPEQKIADLIRRELKMEVLQ